MSKIKLFSLGGLDENGKNMFIIEVDKEIFVFEAGLKYADEFTLGIDYIIPNISYLKENKKRIKGIFLTHGHEENIGALPDLMPDLEEMANKELNLYSDTSYITYYDEKIYVCITNGKSYLSAISSCLTNNFFCSSLLSLP